MSIHLANSIAEVFMQEPSAYVFLSKLMSRATVYMFGGAVRDFVDGKLESARDIDLVIESISNDNDRIDIPGYLESSVNVSYKKNRYDGYKIYFNNNFTVDVWNLKDTWAFKNNKLTASATNLMKSVFLNIDALVYSLNDDLFLENCNVTYIDIINNHFLDIVFDETPYEELNLLRALVFRKRYSLELSPKLNQRFMRHLECNISSAINNFMSLQIAHYNQELLDRAELASILCRIQSKQ